AQASVAAQRPSKAPSTASQLPLIPVTAVQGKAQEGRKMNVRRLLAYEGGFEGSPGGSEAVSGPIARRLLHLHRSGEQPDHLPARRVGALARRLALTPLSDPGATAALPHDERPGNPMRVRP